MFDSAHAFGSTVEGRAVGGFGDAEVFSLSATKLLVAGEGGLVATNSDGLAEKLRRGRNYGNGDDYDPLMLGLSARLSEWNAALALRGLEGLDRRIVARARIATIYRAAFDGVPGLTMQAVPDENVSAWKDFSVVIEPEEFGTERDEVRTAIANSLETRAYFDPPLHRQRIFAAYPAREKLPVTEWISRGVISLPIYSRLSDAEARLVAAALLGAHGRRRIRSALVAVGS